jgi:putative two-component system response regulator
VDSPPVAILVVDDDPGVRGLLERLLTTQGYSVSTAEDAESARKSLATTPADLVLLDVGLPDTDGLALSREIKDNASMRHLPIVLMSASMDPVGIENLGRADAILPKPFKRTELLSWIRVLLSASEAQSAAARTEAVLVSLAVLVETRSMYGQEHVWRVADVSRRLALAAGLSDRDTVLVRRAALLHDIGLIATPEAVLRKPGELTPDEWKHVKGHSALGADLCMALVDGPEVAAIIRSHHEHWDGSGYPDGLAGDAIPIGARIVALADAFAAFTADRPYRMSLSPVRALERLESEAGSQWDSRLVRLLGPIVSPDAPRATRDSIMLLLPFVLAALPFCC